MLSIPPPQDQVLLHSLGWPRTYYVDEAGLELTYIEEAVLEITYADEPGLEPTHVDEAGLELTSAYLCLLISGIKGMHYNAWL